MKGIEINWLKNIRIALIGNYVPAPLAAYLLSAVGAEVIKIERGEGDYLRHSGRMQSINGEKMSGMFASLNAGFKSVSIEYQTPEGAEVLKSMLEKVDVFLDGCKPGTIEKYIGICPSKLSESLIYIPISAFGQIGPMALLGGHDNNALALAGNLSYTNLQANGAPAVFSAPVADFFSGQTAAFAALAAILAKKENALSINKLDVSMLHAGFFMNFLEIADQNFGLNPAPKPSDHWINGGMANYRNYGCKDGKFVFFGGMEPHLLHRFLQFHQLESTPQPQLIRVLEALFLSKDQIEWLQIGADLDVCISPVNDLNAAIAEPQIQALGLAVPNAQHGLRPSFPVGFGPESLQPTVNGSAPKLGQHTREILQKLAVCDAAKMRQLMEDGILKHAD